MSIKLENITVKALVDALNKAIEISGKPDLLIAGGYLTDDRPATEIVIINKDGEDWQEYGGNAIGLFIE